MTEFSVEIHNSPVPVTADPGIDISKAIAAVPFVEWKNEMDPSIDIRNIHIQSLDMFGPHRVGFLKFKASAYRDGNQLPGIVFMRGGSVCVLVVLECEGRQYSLLCNQARVPIGRPFLELPAGMLDGSGHFAGVAAKEMEEETGLVMSTEDLIDLTDLAYGSSSSSSSSGTGSGSGSGDDSAAPPVRGVYTSCGGTDEFLRVFLYNKSVTRQELEAMQGKMTGCLQENEVITLKIVPMEELWRVTSDAKVLSALCLWEKLRARGDISN